VPDAPTQSRRNKNFVQIVPVGQPFDREVRDIESRPWRGGPIAANPSAVDANLESWSKQTDERPVKPVIDNISAAVRVLEDRERKKVAQT
jgi:hypothetical protein